MNLAPKTQSWLAGTMSNINLNTFPYDYGDIYRLVENSHTLYIINHSILFLITIHTVIYHSNPQSLHLSCLCLLFQITLRYLIVFLYFLPSFKSRTAPHHFLFLLYIKCIKKHMLLCFY